ncbi:GDP dissociation inhibitor [Nitzschia inconspicua]|uniref:GDP dissociation inhibitor n=1 Tax=Nitzschia inconspicua TaxID=303405 RepID=A0A9K3M8W1_9STRA|nr:GDP dissociation inhibitor [Nitzschia inconspicua]
MVDVPNEINGLHCDANTDDKQQPTPNEQSTDDPPRDDEGLLLEYDAVICGTGLVQSILASALARAGKSVLHCDGSDLYGELDAVWSFETIEQLYDQYGQGKGDDEEISNSTVDKDISSVPLSPKGGLSSLQFHSLHTTRYFGIETGTAVESRYGKGTVRSIERNQTKNDDTFTLQLELSDWKLADQKSPVLYISVPSTVMDDPVHLEEHLHAVQNIRSTTTVEAEELMKLHRFFALDATPAFILASGPAVQGMIASNVADYLEFKAVEGLYWLEASQDDDDTFELSRVPCSKNDVFGTKLLAPMDKRRLMKFIQLSMDYATKMSVAEELEVEAMESEVEVLSLNERHLNQGRSLARPQNKAVATNDLQALEQHMKDGNLSFDEFLTQHYKLSPKLRSIVRYALAWETHPTSTSLATGMLILRRHLQALGRYGNTAFLCPMYGSGELSQAFCRSAAVFGATYLLRRAPLAIQYEEKLCDDSSKTVKRVILSGDTGSDEEIVKEKLIKCSNVVVPATALMTGTKSTCRIVRRLSILKGQVIPSENREQRYVVFIPPNTIGNSHAIHGVLLDRSVAVSPFGCTLLHLTTTVDNKYHDPDNILEHAKNAVLTSKRLVNNKGDDVDSLVELYHVTFSHSLAQVSEEPSNLTNGIHTCNHSGHTLTADVAFEQARSLFQTICPGMEFLGLSKSFDEAIQQRAREKRYDDDEKMMLESALSMIVDKSANSNKSAATTAANDVVS